MNNNKKNKNQGFSLVELIVAISIMAILLAVLAPSMIYYVERSRSQKDDSAMGEVVNTIKLGLANQEAYDEILYYATYGNISCYIDRPTAADLTPIITKEGGTRKDQYIYDDDSRLKDETIYYATGNMRGTTITFEPEHVDGNQCFILKNAVINKYIQGIVQDGLNTSMVAVDRISTADDFDYLNEIPDYEENGTLGAMASEDGTHSYLYSHLKSIVGEKIELSSQTYRNSEYTVFLQMGSTGGSEDIAQDMVRAYGQWNGTNLPFLE